MSDLRKRLETALSGRYRLERALGSGGMASVFAAEDLRHHRAVAIKVLHPELAAAIGPERFQREIETVGRLTHPHILPMFDSGTADGLPYFVMPVVEGESLRVRLAREQQLGVAEAVQLAGEVADALAYAHAHGVVHRDVKPENILLAGGHALLADFGIAHAVEGADRERLTRTGIVVGTPLYLSPEQAAGGRAVDGRSDQYALACVLYEMLAGMPPFTGPTAESLIHQHLSLAPRPMTALRSGVPPHTSDALDRALAKVPGDRFASCTAFAAACSGLENASARVTPSALPMAGAAIPTPAGSVPVPVPTPGMSSAETLVLPSRAPPRSVGRRVWVLIALVALAGSAVALRAWFTPRAEGPIRSIAVLPLENLSGDPEQQFFADGMTEELTSELSRIQALRVISRASVRKVVEQKLSLRQVAQALRVDAVVEGSVRRNGGEVAVSAQLVDTRGERQLWGERYVRRLADVLNLQNELARAIAREVQVQLTPAERTRLLRARDVRPEAYEAVMRGRGLLENAMREANYRAALDFFEAAVRVDSTYAPAWAGISAAWYALSSQYVPPRDAMPRVRAAAERAIALDAEQSRAHAMLGAYLCFYEWRWAEGEGEFRRAIALDPGDAWARVLFANMLGSQRRFEEARAEWALANSLDPLSEFSQVGAAWCEVQAESHDAAIALLIELQARHPNCAPAYYNHGTALVALGRAVEALAPLRRGAELADSPYALALLAVALAGAGHTREAEAILAQLQSMDPKKLQFTYLSMVEISLGRFDDAFAHLERSLERRDEELNLLGTSPFWSPLRSDPRYARLLDRLGLPHPPGTAAAKPV